VCDTLNLHRHRSAAGIKWYENNTVLTISSIGGLAIICYTIGIVALVIYYKVIVPRQRAALAKIAQPQSK
jgi:hypothetical protein